MTSTAFRHFARLTREQRLALLQQQGQLSAEETVLLQQMVHPDSQNLLNQYAENVISGFPLPFGIVPEFPIDNRLVIVPMAIEETSVIAAVNKTAKWIRQHGKLITQNLGQEIIGQIQFAKLKNVQNFIDKIGQHQSQWIQTINQTVIPALAQRTGGVSQLVVRILPRPDQGQMAVVHVLMNPGNAMGANLINQVCEFLRSPLAETTGEVVNMCILSNLADHQLVRTQIILDNIQPMMAERIVEAGLFAQCDPYRASTHNKGIMNGMDAVLIATGNDWRAVEAGVHAYAARTGQYRPLSEWQYQNQQLIGTLITPMMVGTVGGVTRTHPMAKLALKLSQIQHAAELARLIAAVGLVQNLAALRALTQEGIVKGHMKLHLHNLLLTVNADENERGILKQIAQNFLTKQGKITESDMVYLLQEMRR